MLEQSLWWLVPFALLMLVMLHAMMEFTVSLLVQRPPARRKPTTAGELRKRLLAADQADQPHPLVRGKDCDLEIYWEQREAPPPGRLSIAKAASSGRLRFLLDERRFEMRMNQVSRSYYFFFGLTGWLPRLSGFAGVQSGPPGHAATEKFGRIANRSGWSVRPVLWWFQATYNGYRWLETLTPAVFRRWPARRFWGILYPLSYALGVGYLVLILGSADSNDVVLLVGISAIWWGAWAFLAWMLRGFPSFRRRGRR